MNRKFISRTELRKVEKTRSITLGWRQLLYDVASTNVYIVEQIERDTYSCVHENPYLSGRYIKEWMLEPIVQKPGRVDPPRTSTTGVSQRIPSDGDCKSLHKDCNIVKATAAGEDYLYCRDCKVEVVEANTSTVKELDSEWTREYCAPRQHAVALGPEHGVEFEELVEVIETYDKVNGSQILLSGKSITQGTKETQKNANELYNTILKNQGQFGNHQEAYKAAIELFNLDVDMSVAAKVQALNMLFGDKNESEESQSIKEEIKT